MQCSTNTWQAYNRWPSQFALYDEGLAGLEGIAPLERDGIDTIRFEAQDIQTTVSIGKPMIELTLPRTAATSTPPAPCNA